MILRHAGGPRGQRAPIASHFLIDFAERRGDARPARVSLHQAHGAKINGKAEFDIERAADVRSPCVTLAST